MPMKVKAKGFDDINRKPVGVYRFLDKYTKQWRSFWNEMGGDKDGIISWAKAAKIESPDEWYYGLYKFLFSGYAGDDILLKTAASANFQRFVASVLQNHIKNPNERPWYIKKGITYTGFVDVLDRASEIIDESTLIAFLNARIYGFGDQLFNEYLLGKAGHILEAKIKASNFNYKAYCIESKHGDKIVKIGATVRHQMYPNERLEILKVNKDAVWAQNEHGSVSYIEDVWNLEQTA